MLQNDKSEKIENDFTFCVVTMDLSIVLHFFTAAKMAFYDTTSLCNYNVKHESAIDFWKLFKSIFNLSISIEYHITASAGCQQRNYVCIRVLQFWNWWCDLLHNVQIVLDFNGLEWLGGVTPLLAPPNADQSMSKLRYSKNYVYCRNKAVGLYCATLFRLE